MLSVLTKQQLESETEIIASSWEVATQNTEIREVPLECVGTARRRRRKKELKPVSNLAAHNSQVDLMHAYVDCEIQLGKPVNKVGKVSLNVIHVFPTTKNYFDTTFTAQIPIEMPTETPSNPCLRFAQRHQVTRTLSTGVNRETDRDEEQEERTTRCFPNVMKFRKSERKRGVLGRGTKQSQRQHNTSSQVEKNNRIRQATWQGL